ncbi:hypothetical protein KSC_064430 [Ktedonobacter sp. SOSP1-52]|nr:hypothetical protein KSC_064430 [Ktedonobacter sp. SOSP1-52]
MNCRVSRGKNMVEPEGVKFHINKYFLVFPSCQIDEIMVTSTCNYSTQYEERMCYVADYTS